MKGEIYTTLLGQLFGNFHGLEMVLRAFLANRDPRQALTKGQDFTALQVGDVVAETPFTDYASLGQLITQFNELVPSDRRIDPALVELRDALAHGRVWSTDGDFPLRLLKFSKPREGFATVTWAATLTEDWLDQQRGRVLDAMVRATGHHPRAGRR